MALYMYTVAGDCPDNEELARRVQTGDKNAAELLVSNNDGYLTELAAKHSARCDMEDLKQEGAMALLAAAKKDPSYGTKLLTYATPAIESAMMDYGVSVSTTLAVPPGRYRISCEGLLISVPRRRMNLKRHWFMTFAKIWMFQRKQQQNC